jgi:methylase of polypeptide subunit release factors
LNKTLRHENWLMAFFLALGSVNHNPFSILDIGTGTGVMH